MEENSDDPAAAAAAADHEAADSAEQQQQQQQQQTEERQQLPQQVEEESQDQEQQPHQQEPQQQQQQQSQQQQQQQPQQQQQQQQLEQQPHHHQSMEDEDIMNADESRLFIDELERRISLCEAAVGLGAGELEPKSSSSSHETSVVLALCRLQHQATAAMRGSLAEIEAKCTPRPAAGPGAAAASCAAAAAGAFAATALAAALAAAASNCEGLLSAYFLAFAAAATVNAAAAVAAAAAATDSELKVWLEGGPLSAARLLLTLQAKRDCVLQQEEQLLAVASQLRNLHLLQEYVNPPCLSELAEYKRRMHALEAQGSALALQVARLEERVTHLAALYSTTMNMVSSVIEEWHCTLSKAEAAPDESSASSEDAALRL